MAFGKLGQTLSALEIFDLVREDLDKVEREIGLESLASTDAITYIGQYLQSGGGKRLRPVLVLLSGGWPLSVAIRVMKLVVPPKAGLVAQVIWPLVGLTVTPAGAPGPAWV